MRDLADIVFKGEGAATVDPVLMAMSLLLIVVVLLISPIRGAAMEPAR
jgi:hypothetical protein